MGAPLHQSAPTLWPSLPRPLPSTFNLALDSVIPKPDIADICQTKLVLRCVDAQSRARRWPGPPLCPFFLLHLPFSTSSTVPGLVQLHTTTVNSSHNSKASVNRRWGEERFREAGAAAFQNLPGYTTVWPS